MLLDFSLRPAEEEPLYDVIIIGGGPAGLSAAQYAARAQLKTVVLDKSPTAGALGITSKIENYPGVPQAMTGADLLAIFRQQALQFGAQYVQSQVVGVNFEGEIKEVQVPDKTYRGQVVIIATGSMGRKPTIEGEAELIGRGVSYCATCDAAFFVGKEAAVVGETDEAFEEALLAAKFARKVYLLTPTAQPKASAALQAKVQAHPSIELRPGVRAREILGERSVEGLRVSERGRQETEVLPVKAVFIYLQGRQPIVDFLGGAVELTEAGCIKVNASMETSKAGIYAIGDVTCQQLRQAVIAAAEGAIAALEADKYLHRRRQVRPDWS